jgi:hypothetical protein
MSESSNVFWSNNPEILLQKNKLKYFFPNAGYTMVQNLNAVVRMFMYLSIVLILYTKNPQYLLLTFGALFVTYLLFTYYPNPTEMFYTKPENICDLSIEDKREFRKKIKKDIMKECVTPTVDNPFMNFNHITDNYHRPPACKAFLYNDDQSMKVREEVTDTFNDKLYRDVGDLYSRRNGQREFYTVAYNGIPDQTSFAKWLYGNNSNGTCKENGLKCAPYTGSML